jgi:hypothetical protein
LDLETGDEFQMRLQRMVKYTAGIKVATGNGKTAAEPAPTSDEEAVEHQPVHD